MLQVLSTPSRKNKNAAITLAMLMALDCDPSLISVGDKIHTEKLNINPLLADVYRGLFKFGVFNAVQSKCYDVVRTIFTHRDPYR